MYGSHFKTLRDFFSLTYTSTKHIYWKTSSRRPSILFSQSPTSKYDIIRTCSPLPPHSTLLPRTSVASSKHLQLFLHQHQQLNRAHKPFVLESLPGSWGPYNEYKRAAGSPIPSMHSDVAGSQSSSPGFHRCLLLSPCRQRDPDS